ncbi:hypothetical protein HSB1_30610 [Halogranum salarium B-1]|uniref:Uncharacterized protein n=1 Tax=Halogranum salarium B-1 TaxID=1210908 RepID=J2ZZV8_9EURY|nr:hypothetical protein HSB1_30610 [Halogranum salarium B-1]
MTLRFGGPKRQRGPIQGGNGYAILFPAWPAYPFRTLQLD